MEIKLNKVKEMMKHCAPGYWSVEKEEYIQFHYNGKAFWNFPRGKHGGKNPQIEDGHIRKMARHLGVIECCNEFFGF